MLARAYLVTLYPRSPHGNHGERHRAAFYGDPSIVEFLLSAPSPVAAASNGHGDVAKLLATQGGAECIRDEHGETPLDKAVEAEEKECAAVLRSHGATSGIGNSGGDGSDGGNSSTHVEGAPSTVTTTTTPPPPPTTTIDAVMGYPADLTEERLDALCASGLTNVIVPMAGIPPALKATLSLPK